MKCAWIACELDAVIRVGKITDEPIGYCFPHALDRMHAELFDVRAALQKLRERVVATDDDTEREPLTHAIQALESAMGANEPCYLLRRANADPIADGWIFAIANGPGDWDTAKSDAEWMGEPITYEILEAVLRVVGTRVFPQVVCDKCGNALPGDWEIVEGDRLCSTCTTATA